MTQFLRRFVIVLPPENVPLITAQTLVHGLFNVGFLILEALIT